MKKLCLVLVMVVCIVADSIMHLPLDQRFTTRVAFLNMAAMTPFSIKSLPENLLPSLKKSGDPLKISDWLVSSSYSNNRAVLSLQMLLYGGLIGSRISNFSFSQLSATIDQLETIKLRSPSIKFYASAVVMRIPNFDTDFEEPSYWANYGKSIYNYSYFTHKYNKTGDEKDQAQSQYYKNKIPSDILQDFIWRRNRNQNVLKQLLVRLGRTKAKGQSLFQKLYITLDDNAEYGFNIQEAEQLKNMVKNLSLTEEVLIYPGADQVPLALLSKLVADEYKLSPSIQLVYRNQSTINLIPNYEGQPLSQSILYQIQAAGGQVKSTGDITLIVNNFDGPSQKEASNQEGDKLTDFNKFNQSICSEKHNIIGFVDNKYSNGADINFVSYILELTKKCGRNISQWAYAGWNTNGNTVGTVISNSIILHMLSFKNLKSNVESEIGQRYCLYCSPCQMGDYKCGNAYFNLLRILEDRDWQAILRQKMISYIREVPDESFNHLDSDRSFYEKFALKSLKSKAKLLAQEFELNFSLSQVYYPWNRTFEIGMVGDIGNSLSEL